MNKETDNLRHVRLYEYDDFPPDYKISLVVDYAIPLANAKTTEEKQKVCLNFCLRFLEDFTSYMATIVQGFDKELLFKNQAKRIEKQLTTDFFQKKLIALQEIVYGMITIPILSKRGEPIPEGVIRLIRQIEHRLTSLRSERKLKVNWKSYGRTYAVTIDHAIEEKSLFFVFEARLLIAAEFAFHSKKDEPALDGPGFDKVGICPNCGIFFEKKRKNQEYCSSNCKSAAMMRRMRSRKKS